MNQYYAAEILKEYVIRGNTAILKCNIPSFVADYVSVEGWLVDDVLDLLPTKDNYGKHNIINNAATHHVNVEVVSGNSALLQ